MIDDLTYKFFADYVFQHTGILYVKEDYYRLDSRINSLVRNYDLGGPSELVSKFRGTINPQMHSLVVDLFTNNETYFMRDLKPFKAFAKIVIPEIIEKNNSASVWSCACSTGQEVYSLLMALETFGEGQAEKINLVASDISDNALSIAKNGEYSSLEVQRGLPAPLLIKYFNQKADAEKWSITSRLKDKVDFFSFNLLKGQFPEKRYDIIFCRNVLIYQNTENKKKILSKIEKALRPGGYLFLGAGESLIKMDLKLKQVTKGDAIVYYKEEA